MNDALMDPVSLALEVASGKYDTIERGGFLQRVVEGDGGPRLVPSRGVGTA